MGQMPGLYRAVLINWLISWRAQCSETEGRTEACERSIVSKMRLITGVICITSPLIRHNFLLSSSTVFMFSIHTASIGPSKITHFLSGVSVIANSRNVFAVTPSDHCYITHHTRISVSTAVFHVNLCSQCCSCCGKEPLGISERTPFLLTNQHFRALKETHGTDPNQ